MTKNSGCTTLKNDKMFKTAKRLFKRLFSKRVRTKRDHQMLWGLQMRAWFAFCANNITYIFYMVEKDEFESLMPMCDDI